MTRNTIARSYGKSVFGFVRSFKTLPGWRYHFGSPLAVKESCCRSTPSRHRVVLAICIFTVLIGMQWSPCSNLHFSDDKYCRIPSHMLICHLYTFCGDVSTKVYDSFFNWVFLLLSLKSPLCIIDDRPSSRYVVCKYFLPVWLDLILIALYFAKKFSIFIYLFTYLFCERDRQTKRE